MTRGRARWLAGLRQRRRQGHQPGIGHDPSLLPREAPAEIAPSQEKNPPSLNQKSKSSSSSRDLTTSAATEENETKIILTTVTTTTKITPAFDDLAKAEFAPIVLGASAKNSSRGFIKLNFLLYFYAVVGFLTIVLVYDIYRPKRE